MTAQTPMKGCNALDIIDMMLTPALNNSHKNHCMITIRMERMLSVTSDLWLMNQENPLNKNQPITYQFHGWDDMRCIKDTLSLKSGNK